MEMKDYKVFSRFKAIYKSPLEFTDYIFLQYANSLITDLYIFVYFEFIRA